MLCGPHVEDCGVIGVEVLKDDDSVGVGDGVAVDGEVQHHLGEVGACLDLTQRNDEDVSDAFSSVTIVYNGFD